MLQIVKGRYPPVSARYSRPLRELLASLLATLPSSR